MNKFQKRVREAVRDNDSSILVGLALEEAEKMGKEIIFHILRHFSEIASSRFEGWDDAGVRSAAIVRTGSRFSIHFNPGFVSRYVTTGQDLLYLVLHELLHKVRGDLRRSGVGEDVFPLIRDFVNNLAADLLVNSYLRKRLFPESPPMLSRLYRNESIWLSFLCPPDVLPGLGNLRANSAMLKKCLRACMIKTTNSTGADLEPLLEKSAFLYRAGWFESPSFDLVAAGIHELTKALLWQMPLSHFENILEKLIGEHPFSDFDGDPWWDWFRKEFEPYLKMGGYSETASEEETGVAETRSRELYEAVRRAVSFDTSSATMNVHLHPEIGVVPFWGRKELFLHRGGYRPVFFPNPVVSRDWSNHKVHLYIDVSGSTRRLWDLLYGLVLHLRDEIGEPFYLFSNQVGAIGLNELKNGRVRTTGGTDFDCVFEHARANHFRKILVITDGHAGLRGNYQKIPDLYLVLTEDNPDCSLIDLAGRNQRDRKWWVIDLENHGKPMNRRFLEKKCVLYQ